MKNQIENKVLIAAGFDPSGGAGIVRDLQTIWDSGIGARTVVTAITAQNEARFLGWEPVNTGLLNQQLQAVVGGNTCKWVKIGMVGTIENLDCILETVHDYCKTAFVLLDTVLNASTGPALSNTDLAPAILKRSAYISLLTPNIPELERLTETTITTQKQAVSAAERLIDMGLRAIVVKGGHLPGPPKDILVTANQTQVFDGIRFPGTVHGSGCAFSSAIIANLASKDTKTPGFKELTGAVEYAKNYVAQLFQGQ